MRLRQNADLVASAGRNGDDVLVHMSAGEVEDLQRIALHSGIGALTVNPETGYPEAFSLGGLLKGIGSLVAPIAGTALLGPLGGALAGGLFTGLTEGSLKKGLLAGMGSYMGGKALQAAAGAGNVADDAVGSAINAGAAQGSNISAGAQSAIDSAMNQVQSNVAANAGMGGLQGAASTAATSAAAASPGMLDGVNLGDVWRSGRSGVEAGIGSLFEGRAPYVLYPMMAELNTAIQMEGGDPNRFDYDRWYSNRMDEYRRNTSGLGPTGVRYFSQGGQVDGLAPSQLSEWQQLMRQMNTSYREHAGGGPSVFKQYGWAQDTFDRWNQQAADGGYDSINDYFGNTSFDRIYTGGNDEVYDDAIARRQAMEDVYRLFGGQFDPETGDVSGPGFSATPQALNPTPEGFVPGYHGEHAYFRPVDGEAPPPTNMGGERFGQNPAAVSASIDAILNQGSSSFLDRLSNGNPLMRPAPSQDTAVVDTPLVGGPQIHPPSHREQARNKPRDAASARPVVVDPPTAEVDMMMNGYAGGGIVALKGGMSDSVPAHIDGRTPARLSEGEFVVPADVVSMIGDGNTDAGAGELEAMLARIRTSKTGRAEQLPPTNFNLLPG